MVLQARSTSFVALTAAACLLLSATMVGGQPSRDFNVTLLGNLSLPNLPLDTDGTYFFAMGFAWFRAFHVADPTLPVWKFSVGPSFCCVDSASHSGSGSSTCGTSAFSLVRPRGAVLVDCGPSLALLNVTNGAVITMHTLANGDQVSQAAVDEFKGVAVVSLVSNHVVAFNLTDWTVLWVKSVISTMAPMVSATPTVAVAFTFDQTFNGDVAGFDLLTGQLVWNMSVAMWAQGNSAVVPLQSTTVFAWVGPDFATVRMVYIPSGDYTQYIADTTLQYVCPTNSGLVLLASITHITALNASTGATMWSRSPGQKISFMRVAYGGQFVTLYAPPVGDQRTLVLSTADGSIVADCGVGHCAEPCVSATMFDEGVALVANCSRATGTAELFVVDLSKGGAPRSTGVTLPATVDNQITLQSVSNGLVAVTTPWNLQFARVVDARPPTAAPRSGASVDEGFTEHDQVMASGVAGGALALAGVFVLVIVVFRRRRQGQDAATPPVQLSQQQRTLLAESSLEHQESDGDSVDDAESVTCPGGAAAGFLSDDAADESLLP